MQKSLLMFLMLTSFLTVARGETVAYKFEFQKILDIKIEAGTCEVKTVDTSFCELINLKSRQVEKTVSGANCEQDKTITQKTQEKGLKKYEIKKTGSVVVTATKKMNILVEQEGSRSLIPFYSNQEAPKIATNSCDFPLTPEDHALVADRAKKVFETLAQARTVYRNQFNQCYTKNSTFEIHLVNGLTGKNGPVPNKIFAYAHDFRGYKIVDCLTVVGTPVSEILKDESCMVLKSENGVRATCTTTADDIDKTFEDSSSECADETYNSVIKALIFKGYEKFTERWYVRRAHPIE
jgi:hypothetical protein